LLLFNDIPPYAQKNETGFSFWIKVTPKASKNRIGDLVEATMGRKMLKVYVTSVPADNLANIAVIEVLAEYLHKAKSKIQIVSGHTMREKRIQVLS
jgi:uncharacterized protein